jgi:hypothetical protein
MSRTHWVKGTACFTARCYIEAIDAFIRIRDANQEVNYYLAASYALAGYLPRQRPHMTLTRHCDPDPEQVALTLPA